METCKLISTVTLLFLSVSAFPDQDYDFANEWASSHGSVVGVTRLSGASFSVTNESGIVHSVFPSVNGGVVIVESGARKVVACLTPGSLLPDGSPDFRKPIWAMLSSERRSVPLMRTSQSSGTTEPSYVIDGFGTGGKFTHWAQSVDSAGLPLYNYYTRASDSFGPATGGLGLSFMRGTLPPRTQDNRKVPCGCVATAYSALAQCMGLRSITPVRDTEVKVPDSYEWSGSDWVNTSSVSELNAYPESVVADWSVLPRSMGGLSDFSVSESFWESESSLPSRSLIGKIAYDFGLVADMSYGWTSSSAYTSLVHSRIVNGTMSPVSFPGGFGAKSPEAVSGWNPSFSDDWIRSGRPVVMSISNGSTGHCVLGVGRDSSTSMTYVFMGWGGESDGLYLTDSQPSIAGYTSITATYGYSGYGEDVVPVRGRIVRPDGSAFPWAVVRVSVSGSERAAFVADSDGRFRGFYRPDFGSSGYIESVSVGGSSTNRNRSVTLSSGYSSFAYGTASIGDLTVSHPGISGADFVSNGDLHDAVESAKARNVPLAIIGVMPGQSSVMSNSSVTVCAMYSSPSNFIFAGEYAFVDPFSSPFTNVMSRGTHILAYGVSTNSVDFSEYARKSKAAMAATRQ